MPIRWPKTTQFHEITLDDEQAQPVRSVEPRCAIRVRASGAFINSWDRPAWRVACGGV